MVQDHYPPMGVTYLRLSADWAEHKTINPCNQSSQEHLTITQVELIFNKTCSFTWCQEWGWPLVWTSSAQSLLCKMMINPGDDRNGKWTTCVERFSLVYWPLKALQVSRPRTHQRTDWWSGSWTANLPVGGRLLYVQTTVRVLIVLFSDKDGQFWG